VNTPPLRTLKILSNLRLARPMARWRTRIRRVKAWLLAKPPVVLVARTVREVGHDDATHMAAGVAFYAILSLFPMVLGLVAVLGLVLEPGSTQELLVEFLREYLPEAGDLLSSNVSASPGIRGFAGFFSLLGLFWTASAVFGAISRAVNRAWDVHQDRNFVVEKARHIGMALAVGLLFMLSLGATATLQLLGQLELSDAGPLSTVPNYGTTIVARSLPLVFSLAIFLLIYKFVPNTPTRWRYIWPGVLLAAISFEVGKSAFVFYLDHFANFGRVYGSLGSLVALMMWIYLSALILIVGAEFASEYGRMREGVEQGRLIADRDQEYG
jgi:membrane protein